MNNQCQNDHQRSIVEKIENERVRPWTTSGALLNVFSVGYHYQHQSVEEKIESPSTSFLHSNDICHCADVNIMDMPLKPSNYPPSPIQRPLTSRDRAQQYANVALPHQGMRPITAPATTTSISPDFSNSNLIYEDNPATDITATVRCNTPYNGDHLRSSPSIGLFAKFVNNLAHPSLTFSSEIKPVIIYPSIIRKIHYAIKNNNPTLLLNILSYLPSFSHHLYLSSKDITGSTPLIMACKRNYTDIVRILLTTGVNVNMNNTRGEKAIFISLRKGYHEITRLLVMFGSNLTEKDFQRFIAKLKSEEKETSTTSAYLFPPLLDKKDHQLSVYIRSSLTTVPTIKDHVSQYPLSVSSTYLGLSMLHWACVHGKEPVVEVLLKCPTLDHHSFVQLPDLISVVEIKDRIRFEEFEQHNALSIAYLFHHSKLVQQLEASGLTWPIKSSNILIFDTEISPSQQTAEIHAKTLMSHLQNRNSSLMNAYLDHSVPTTDLLSIINYRFPFTGQTLLYGVLYLDEDESCDVARTLISRGSLVDPTDFECKSPVQLAWEGQKYGLVDMLLKAGATSLSCNHIIQRLKKINQTYHRDKNEENTNLNPEELTAKSIFPPNHLTDLIGYNLLRGLISNRYDSDEGEGIVEECLSCFECGVVEDDVLKEIIKMLLAEATSRGETHIDYILEKLRQRSQIAILKAAVSTLENRRYVEKMISDWEMKEEVARKGVLFAEAQVRADRLKLSLDKTDRLRQAKEEKKAKLIKPKRKDLWLLGMADEPETKFNSWIDEAKRGTETNFASSIQELDTETATTATTEKRVRDREKEEKMIVEKKELKQPQPLSKHQSKPTDFRIVFAPYQQLSIAETTSHRRLPIRPSTSPSATHPRQKPEQQKVGLLTSRKMNEPSINFTLPKAPFVRPKLRLINRPKQDICLPTPPLTSTLPALPLTHQSHLIFAFDDLETLKNKLRGQGILSLGDAASYNRYLSPLVKNVESGKKRTLLLEEYMDCWEELARNDGLEGIEKFLTLYDKSRKLKLKQNNKTADQAKKGATVRGMSHLGVKRRNIG